MVVGPRDKINEENAYEYYLAAFLVDVLLNLFILFLPMYLLTGNLFICVFVYSIPTLALVYRDAIEISRVIRENKENLSN
jgi:hypothetical protein